MLERKSTSKQKLKPQKEDLNGDPTLPLTYKLSL